MLKRAKDAFEARNTVFFNDYNNVNNCFRDVFAENEKNLEAEIKNLFNLHEIELPSKVFLSRISLYSQREYHINFMENIKLHYTKRLKVFFKASVGVNPIEGITPKIIYDTVAYMTYDKALTTPCIKLINRIPHWNDIGIIVNERFTQNPENRGFFARFVNKNWFRSVDLFFGMQCTIDDYQKMFGIQDEDNYQINIDNNEVESGNDENRDEVIAPKNAQRERNQRNTKNSRKKISKCKKSIDSKYLRNFIVVPQTSLKRRHIKIYSTVLHSILCELKIDPKIPNANTGKLIRMTAVEFNKDLRKH